MLCCSCVCVPRDTTWYWMICQSIPLEKAAAPSLAAINCLQLFIKGRGLVRLLMPMLGRQLVVSLLRSC